MPIAVGAFDVDAIFGVDDRHHRVAHVTPGMGSASCGKISMSIGTPRIFHESGDSDELTAVQSNRQSISGSMRASKRYSASTSLAQ